MTYNEVAVELKRRIEALIPEHPEVLQMTNPFDLFKIGLSTKGLDDLTLGMASACLELVKKEHRK